MGRLPDLPTKYRSLSCANSVHDLLKRLAELRAEATKQEMEHNRYKLVEGGISSTSPAQP
jgi:hypothetical protein